MSSKMTDSGVGTSNENSDNPVFDYSHCYMKSGKVGEPGTSKDTNREIRPLIFHRPPSIDFNPPAIPLPTHEQQIPPELNEEAFPHDFVGKLPSKVKTKKRYSSYLNFAKQRNLRLAASTNNVEMVQKLLASGVDPNSSDEHKRSPLHLAACKGYIDVVRTLLRHGANPNKKDNLGNTPLHLAACTSHIPVVVELLDAGTDVTSNDLNGRTPIELAQSKLKLIQLRPCSTGHVEETRRIVGEICLIVEMMLKFMKIQKEDSSELESLRSRLEKVSTKEEIDSEVQSLLTNLNTLQLR